MQKLDLSSVNQPTKATHSMLDESLQIEQNQESLAKKPTEESSNMRKQKTTLMIVAIIAIIAGTGTGYGAFKLKAKGEVGGSASSGPTPMQQIAGDKVNNGDIFGVQDESTFKDSAEGYLEAGEAEDEGSHRLIRPGGVSQTVFLVSSVTDLDKFIGMGVKVWGETYKGQKAGWLMDVGRVEIINAEAEAPSEE